jgi:diguanylate cyclase (GGDEF)-like protein
MSLTRRLGEAIRRPQQAGAPPDLILRKQLHVATKVAPLANVAGAINILTISTFVIPASLPAFRLGWTLVALALSLNSTRVWLKRWRVREVDRQLRDYTYLLVEVISIGTVNSVLVLHLLPRTTAGEATMLVACQVGVIGCGAIALSTIRSIGISWVCANSFGPWLAIATHPGRDFRVLTYLFLVYFSAVTLGVFFASWSFRARCLAEYASETERLSVGLLLDDFEGGSRDWLWETGVGGRFTRVSERFAEVAGLTHEELQLLTVGALLDRLQPTTEERVTGTGLRLALDTATPFRDLTLRLVVGDAVRYWSISGKPYRVAGADAAGTAPLQWRGVGSDVTAEKLARDEIVRLANTDSLTDLPNRHYFQSALATLMAHRADPSGVTLAILDLDNFKSVNDTLGHDSGDQLLVQLAARLAGVRRGEEVCARMGGDEFAIVLPHTGPAAAPERLAEYFGVLSEPFALPDALIEIRGCLGHASAPTDATTPDKLVTAADLALFAAKNEGGNRVRRVDDRLRERARTRGLALQELGLALEHREIAVCYQPQVAFADDAVVGFEALARWRHPTRGMVAPSDFIPMAEETGLIVPIGRLILLESCQEAAGWPAHVTLAVNISPVELSSTGIVATVRECLERSGLAPHRLQIEVTESAIVQESARLALLALSELGVRVAVDDFGTGYSSFASLRALPVDRLKIDRSLVGALLDDPGDRSRMLMRAVIDMARALELESLAEGVETQAQWTALHSLGCDAFQGFLASEPLAAESVSAYLAARRPAPPGRRQAR